jgi:hypothetical protein
MIDPAVVAEKLLEYAEDKWEWGTFAAFEEEFRGDETFFVPGLGEVKVIHTTGIDYNKNYDGWSEQLSVVFEIDGTLYKASGTYTSFVGSEWDSHVTVVKPVEKTITIYEDV